MQMFFPMNSYAKVMEFSGNEVQQFHQIVTHVFFSAFIPRVYWKMRGRWGHWNL